MKYPNSDPLKTYKYEGLVFIECHDKYSQFEYTGEIDQRDISRDCRMGQKGNYHIEEASDNDSEWILSDPIIKKKSFKIFMECEMFYSTKHTVCLNLDGNVTDRTDYVKGIGINHQASGDTNFFITGTFLIDGTSKLTLTSLDSLNDNVKYFPQSVAMFGENRVVLYGYILKSDGNKEKLEFSGPFGSFVPFQYLAYPDCANCPTNCQACTGVKYGECYKCVDGYEICDGMCYQNCKVNQYWNQADKSCKNCNSQCLGCKRGFPDQCYACANNLILAPDNSCKSQCRSNQVLDKASGTCVDCHANCKSCYGANESQCLSCYDDRSLTVRNKCEINCSDYEKTPRKIDMVAEIMKRDDQGWKDYAKISAPYSVINKHFFLK